MSQSKDVDKQGNGGIVSSKKEQKQYCSCTGTANMGMNCPDGGGGGCL